MRKNRIEKGNREEFKGLKPHSKGESFSRSEIFFFDKRVDKIITIRAIIKVIIDIKKILKIIYIKIFKPYDWKSNILFYTI